MNAANIPGGQVDRPADSRPVSAATDRSGDADAAVTTAELREVLAHFDGMVDRCYDYAEAAKAEGRPIVGIMCEFTPREVILAAGAVPVCLCGGSAETIPAAEQHLPANLCPLIKSTFGYHVTGRNPFLKWADLVVAETTCDGKKKMFELLGATKPMHILELPQKADDADALAYWTSEVRKLKACLEERFQVCITDDHLRAAIRLMNRERRLRRQLAELMTQDPPPLTGRQLIEFKSIISGLEPDLQQYENVLRSVGLGPQAGEGTPPASLAGPGSAGMRPASAATPPGCPPAVGRRFQDSELQGRVRVLLTGVPLVHGAERVLELIENAGAVVVALENCTGLKPILEDVDENDPDPLAAIARKYYHLPCSVMTLNQQRLASLRELAAKFRPHCVVELIWQACLTYDVESWHVRKLVEDELRLPYLKITTDYAPADSARITARLEALLETARARGCLTSLSWPSQSPNPP
jgi:benzoyl-CoA reductase/2-hydroxyglutaryl-CoA dehydratase subunit BcrC/BadD/HgdB